MLLGLLSFAVCKPIDHIIRGATIIDGTGGPRMIGDVGILNGSIICVKDCNNYSSTSEIQGSGYYLTPGFIDVHAHLDVAPFLDNRMLPQVHQGITTVAVGMCGLSPAPFNMKNDTLIYRFFKLKIIDEFKQRPFVNFSVYLEEMGKKSFPVNIVPLVGHGAIRSMVLGNDPVDASEKDIGKMKEIAEEAMKAGAFGMTTGLIYPPGLFANTNELIEISKTISKFGGIYMSHVRSESDDIVKSVEEVIKIGKEAGIPAQVHHFKVCGAKNKGKGIEAVNLIEKARKDGYDVTADQYNFQMSATTFSSLLPPWSIAGSAQDIVNRLANSTTRNQIKSDIINGIPDFDNMWQNVGTPSGIVFLSAPGHDEYSGKSVAELAGAQDPLEWSLDFLMNNMEDDALCLFYEIQEEDMRTIMLKDFVMVGSDCQFVDLASSNKVHPRSVASHSRFLRQYVKEEHFISMEAAIRKMTGFPAERYGISSKGVIKIGYDADINLFSLDKINDTTKDTGNPVLSSGMEYVFVNGKMIIQNGAVTSNKPGNVLRRYNYPISTPAPKTPDNNNTSKGKNYTTTITIVFLSITSITLAIIVLMKDKKSEKTAITEAILV